MTMLDGNAIAGTLRTAFGGDMTATVGVCAACGASGQLARLLVELDGPTVTGRCAGCGNVLLVIVTNRGIACVDVSGFAVLGQPTQPTQS